MATKDKFIHCRLSESDFERFHANAERLGLAPSEYMRYLIRIPVEPHGRECEYSVVVLDRETMGRVHRELVRQGHHYNQAVHALNTIAFFTRRGGGNVEYFTEQLGKASGKLDEVRERQERIGEQLERIERSIVIGG